MVLLHTTRLVSYLVLAFSLWLGIYVVTRSPKRLIPWLTGLTLWTIASLSMSTLLALDPPPEMASLPWWYQLLLPVWKGERVERAMSGWLNGWSVTPAIVFWHHITALIRPGPLNAWRRTRIIGAYVLLGAAILIQAYTPYLFTIPEAHPLYMPTLIPGPLYYPFLFFSFLFVGMSLVNLIRSASSAPTEMPRKQFIILTAATLIAGLTGPVAIAGAVFSLSVPIVIQSTLLGCAVGLIGFGAANYGALTEGRTIRRDFIYNGAIVAGVTILYLLVTWFSVTAYRVPGAAFIFVFMLVIITHSLVDVARRGLDRVFYRRDTRELRADLQRLTRMAGEQDSLDETLSLTLDSLCASVRATFGLILLFESEAVRVAARYRWYGDSLPFSQKDLLADDVGRLEQGHFPEPLSEAALLIPLYAESDQLGVMLLGRPINGVQYVLDEVDMLLYPSDRIAEAVRAAQREADYLRQVAELAAKSERQTAQPPRRRQISVKEVEDGFRHLTDYAYLGEMSLAGLKLVSTHLPQDTVTHVDRGKGVFNILVEALEKLRPTEDEPGRTPGREWYPYLILQRAYVDDIPNRDIMQQLYISEGTFNRTRRNALRAVTRALAEMETGTA